MVFDRLTQFNGLANQRWLHCSPILLALALVGDKTAIADPGVQALPEGANITHGRAQMLRDAGRLDVLQQSQRLITEWNTFNIGAGAHVHFDQPSAAAFALNRVMGGNPSQIMGQLSATGQVALINGAGIIFGHDARIDVGGLLASTLNIDDQAFLAGDFRLSGTGSFVMNHGQIHTRSGGYVALVGEHVKNTGEIHTPNGTAALAAGNDIRLEIAGGGLIGVQLDQKTATALVENSGVIAASDGRVILSAARSGDGIGAAVNQTGRITANRMTANGEGVVRLEAGDGDMLLAGNIETRGMADDVRGGQVIATGANIDVAGSIDASGPGGGGDVLIGGDWQGGENVERRVFNDPDALQESVTVVMRSDASIDASATTLGDGGTIVLWSDITNPVSSTEVAGTLLARGGPGGGDGGFIETSGFMLDTTGAVVRANAPLGAAGLWLLDPKDSVITQVVADGYADTLNTGTNVTNLVSGNMRWKGGVVLEKTDGDDAVLTLRTTDAGDIVFESGAAIISTSGKLDVRLDADGQIDIASGVRFETNGGSTRFSAAGNRPVESADDSLVADADSSSSDSDGDTDTDTASSPSVAPPAEPSVASADTDSSASSSSTESSAVASAEDAADAPSSESGASNPTDLRFAGRISTRSYESVGGQVTLEGNRIALAETAEIDASGAEGGGEVLIGGGWQGDTSEVAESTEVRVSDGASIRSDALDSGDGGTVVLWSSEQTRFDGSISARGAGETGTGGAVETSSRGQLGLRGSVDVSAPSGLGGQWLLDPENLTIVAGSGSAVVDSGGDEFDEGGGESDVTINADSISTALNLGGTTVTLQADNSITIDADISRTEGDTTDAGDDSKLIFKAGDNAASKDGTITLVAGRAISATEGRLSVIFRSDENTTGLADIQGTISTNGGDVTFEMPARLANAAPISTKIEETVSAVSGAVVFQQNVTLAAPGRSVTINAEGPSTGAGFDGLGGHIQFDGDVLSGVPPTLTDNAPQTLVLQNRGNSTDGAGVITFGSAATNELGGDGDAGIRQLTMETDAPVQLNAPTVNIKAITGTPISMESGFSANPSIELRAGGTTTFNVTGGDIQGTTGYTDYIQDSFDILATEADQTLRINSDRSIRISNDHVIDADGNNNFGVELNPFTASDAGGGAIILENAKLISNGGNIQLGGLDNEGGAENLATGVGDDPESVFDGIRITNTELISNAGDIILRAQAPTDDQGGAAVRMTGSGTDLNAGSGLIDILGEVNAQAGSGSKDGVIIGEGGAAQVTLQTTSGNIIITGDASEVTDASGGSQYDGLIISSGALIKTDSGDILLTGRGGGGDKTFIAQNHGIRLEDLGTRILSTSGDIALRGTSGGKTDAEGQSSFGLFAGASAIYIGRDEDRSGASGDIYLEADSMQFDNSSDQRLQISSSGNLLIRPENLNTDIELGNAGSPPESGGQKTLFLGENWFDGSETGIFLPAPLITASEVNATTQRLTIEGNAGGDFKLTLGGVTTGSITFDDDLNTLRDNIQTALETATGIDIDSVTANPGAGTIDVTFSSAQTDLLVGNTDDNSESFASITIGDNSLTGQVRVNAPTIFRSDVSLITGDRRSGTQASVVVNSPLTVQSQPNNPASQGTLYIRAGDPDGGEAGMTAKGVLTADELLLEGGGDFVLTADNQINTLAANIDGRLTLSNDRALTIDTVSTSRTDSVTITEGTGEISFAPSTPSHDGIDLTETQQFDLTVTTGNLTLNQDITVADDNDNNLTGIVSLSVDDGRIIQSETGTPIINADALYLAADTGTSELKNSNQINRLAGDFTADNDAGLTLNTDRTLTIDRIAVTPLTANTASSTGVVTVGTAVNRDGLTATGGTVVLTMEIGDLEQTTNGAVQVAELRVNLPNGALTLDNTSNQIDTLAAKLDTASKDFSLRNAGAMTVGTVDGLDGISLSNEGNLRISLEAGTLTLAKAITTGTTGNLDLRSVGDIAFAPEGGTAFTSLKTGSGTVQLIAVGGITTTKEIGDDFVSIDTEGDVRLQADNGIGADDNRIELRNVTTLAASGGAGGIWIERTAMDTADDTLIVGSVAAINKDWPGSATVTPDPLAGLTTTDNAPITLIAAGTNANLTIREAVSADGSGDVDLRAQGGDIDIENDAANDGIVQSGDGTVQLIAGASITTDSVSGATENNEIETTGAVLLEAGDNIGTDENRIELDGDGLTLAAQAGGDMFLRQFSGSATIGKVEGVNDADDREGLLTNDNDGNITLSSRDGSLTIERSVQTHGAGFIDIRATGTDSDIALNTQTEDADAILAAGVDGLVQVIAQRAITVGNETEASAATTEIKTTGDVLLQAGTTIGSDANRLEMANATRLATQSDGDQFLRQVAGDVTVTTVDAQTGAQPDIDADDLTGLVTDDDGGITLTTLDSDIEVDQPVNAGGAGFIDLRTGETGNVVINDPGGVLSANTGTVQVLAGGAITTASATGETPEIITTGDVLLEAGKNIGEDGKRIEVDNATTLAARTLAVGTNKDESAIFLRRLGIHPTNDAITIGSVSNVSTSAPAQLLDNVIGGVTAITGGDDEPGASSLAGLTTGANNAPVTLTTQGGNLIVLNNIQAHGNGNIDLRTASDHTGSIQINGAQLRSGASGAGTGKIQLISGEDITTNTATGSVSEIATNGTVLLQAAGAIGSDENRIELAGNLDIAAEAVSEIWLNSRAGDTTVATVSSFGTNLDHNDTDLGGLVVTGTDAPVTLTTLSGAITLKQAVTAMGSGDVDLRAGGSADISFQNDAESGLAQSGTGTVQLIAGGSITTDSKSDATDDDEIKTDGSVRLEAGSAIGTETNRIELRGADVVAAEAADAIWLRGLEVTDTLTIGEVAGVNGAATLSGLLTTAGDGPITVTTREGGLTVVEDIQADGDGNIDLRTGTLAINNATLRSGDTGTGAGTIQLVSAGAISTTDTDGVNHIESAGEVLLDAEGAIGAAGERIQLTGALTLAATSGGEQQIRQESGELRVGAVDSIGTDLDHAVADISGLETTDNDAPIDLFINADGLTLVENIVTDGDGAIAVNTGPGGVGIAINDGARFAPGGGTGTGSIGLTASGGISTNTASDASPHFSSEGALTLTSTGGAIGSGSNPLRIENSTPVEATAEGEGNGIFLRQVAGDLVFNTLETDSGPIVGVSVAGDLIVNQVSAAGGAGNLRLETLASGATLTINANVTAGNHQSLIAAGTLNQNANLSAGGTIDVEASTISMASSARTDTGGGNIRYSASNTLSLGRLDAGSGNVLVISGGNINNANGGALNIAASGVQLRAGGAIGPSGGGGAIDLSASTLAATSNGVFNIASRRSLTLGVVPGITVQRVGIDGQTSALAGSTLSTLSSGGGSVSLTSTGSSLRVAAPLSSGGNISLSNTGSISLGATVSTGGSGQITLTASGGSSDIVRERGSVGIRTGTLQVNAGRDVLLTVPNRPGSITDSSVMAGALPAGSVGQIRGSAGRIFNFAQQGNVTTQGISAGTINLRAGGDLRLTDALVINRAGSGRGMTLVAGSSFRNLSGLGAGVLVDNGRGWLIFDSNLDNDISRFAGLTPNFRFFGRSAGDLTPEMLSLIGGGGLVSDAPLRRPDDLVVRFDDARAVAGNALVSLSSTLPALETQVQDTAMLYSPVLPVRTNGPTVVTSGFEGVGLGAALAIPVEAARGFVATLTDVLGESMQVMSASLASGDPLPDWLELTETDGVYALDGFVPVGFEGPMTIRLAVTDRESESVEVIEIDLVIPEDHIPLNVSYRSN